jgi:hypothetical protein
LGSANSGLISALATTAFEVSATSGLRGAGMALVETGAGAAGTAEATLVCPIRTCTVLTRTGVIGSADPGMVASGEEITPLVSGAGAGLS